MRPPAGTFSDFKIVKTRGVAQFVIEVPIDHADGALAALGGLPVGGKERWVAVALLDPKVLKAAPVLIKRDWPMASQIHMRCQEPSLWPFLQQHELFAPLWMEAAEAGGGTALAAELAAEVVRRWCGVASRRFIVPGSEAAECWHTLEAEYEQFQRERDAA